MVATLCLALFLLPAFVYLQGYGLTETTAASFIMLPTPKMAYTCGFFNTNAKLLHVRCRPSAWLCRPSAWLCKHVCAEARQG